MSQLSQKIKNEIVDPITKTKTTKTVVGEVTASSTTNKCRVTFTDINGSKHLNKMVKIRVYGNNAWLPNKGDKVLIEQSGNIFTVISKQINSDSEFKRDNVLKADIYSNLIMGGLPGLIF